MNINKKKTNWDLFIEELSTAGTSVAVSRTVVAPLERIKLILQTQRILNVADKDRYSGTMNAFTRISREQGVLSLWRGNAINVFRVIPNTIIRFTMYDDVKRLLMPAGTSNYSGADAFARKLASGCLASFITLGITYPLDLIRTRIAVDLAKVKDERTYRSFSNAFSKIRRSEGFVGLYKGLGISMVSIIPYVGISLALYDTLKEYLLTPGESDIKKALNYIGAGTISGVTAQILTYPFDTIRRRKQVDGALETTKYYKSSFDIAIKIIKREGTRALYLGLTPSLLKIVPATVIQFVVYDSIKTKYFE